MDAKGLGPRLVMTKTNRKTFTAQDAKGAKETKLIAADFADEREIKTRTEIKRPEVIRSEVFISVDQ